MGQAPRLGDLAWLATTPPSAKGDVCAELGRSFKNISEAIPMPMAREPNTNQLFRQPSSASFPTSHGTKTPANMKAKLPPIDAKPAARPRLPARKNRDSRPIMGAKAMPVPMPMQADDNNTSR